MEHLVYRNFENIQVLEQGANIGKLETLSIVTQTMVKVKNPVHMVFIEHHGEMVN